MQVGDTIYKARIWVNGIEVLSAKIKRITKKHYVLDREFPYSSRMERYDHENKERSYPTSAIEALKKFRQGRYDHISRYKEIIAETEQEIAAIEAAIIKEESSCKE